jgi:hypothetical protein
MNRISIWCLPFQRLWYENSNNFHKISTKNISNFRWALYWESSVYSSAYCMPPMPQYHFVIMPETAMKRNIKID